MSRTPLLLIAAAFGATTLLFAQETDKAWDPKDEPLPKLDEWLQRRRADPGAPVVRVAPAPAAERNCAIPLLPVQPRGNAVIRQRKPNDVGIIRYAEPPAPACESWLPQSPPPLELELRPQK